MARASLRIGKFAVVFDNSYDIAPVLAALDDECNFDVREKFPRQKGENPPPAGMTVCVPDIVDLGHNQNTSLREVTEFLKRIQDSPNRAIRASAAFDGLCPPKPQCIRRFLSFLDTAIGVLSGDDPRDVYFATRTADGRYYAAGKQAEHAITCLVWEEQKRILPTDESVAGIINPKDWF